MFVEAICAAASYDQRGALLNVLLLLLSFFFARVAHYDADKCLCYSFQYYIVMLTGAYKHLSSWQKL